VQVLRIEQPHGSREHRIAKALQRRARLTYGEGIAIMNSEGDGGSLFNHEAVGKKIKIVAGGASGQQSRQRKGSEVCIHESEYRARSPYIFTTVRKKLTAKATAPAIANFLL
jgi:hypothetical protein